MAPRERSGTDQVFLTNGSPRHVLIHGVKDRLLNRSSDLTCFKY